MTKPFSIPLLTPEQFAYLEKELEKPPTEKQIATAKRALKIYNAIEANTCKQCRLTGKHLGGKCPKGLSKCNQYFASKSGKRMRKL